MIVAEKENLNTVKVLINNTEIQLTLLEDRKGNMFVSATSIQPEGIVLFRYNTIIVMPVFRK
jgi:hypothetical protein